MKSPDEHNMNQLNGSSREEIAALLAQLNDETTKLRDREQQLDDQAEELSSQKEELTAAIEELMSKNASLERTLVQLRDRSFELDQILYRTSHDLRSPLSSIKGILSLLQLEPQSDIIRSYARHIEDKAVQMDNLLRSLASFSKSVLEEPRLETIDLNKIIWQVVGEFRHLPGWHLVDVTVELGEPKVYTDPALVVIIFQSLFSNAFVFRDPSKKGTLVIRTQQQNGKWTLDVIDDGDGIDPSISQHIFGMFYRGSERSMGNGLGLYVCRKAVEQLKGSISFRLEPAGTHFTVTLPLQTNPANGSR
ncbi:sensor histidine kinase [Pseudochryseolinea flava]|uniref:histidine kinase n=1 Tax=Pseudochryseolinea flava TaxID=2059302 RepID=A0A364Y684_9BACT|nr:HAMP domain-containing sensor histidine kinase [Pseudochryseolinea flava]RAW02604.1 hypothetical protein DQQ10_00360 [Pseudochryseolinea flava]